MFPFFTKFRDFHHICFKPVLFLTLEKAQNENGIHPDIVRDCLQRIEQYIGKQKIKLRFSDKKI